MVTDSVEATPTLLEDGALVPVEEAQDPLANVGVRDISQLLEVNLKIKDEMSLQ